MSRQSWDFSPPPSAELGDREVPLEGHHLVGKRVALMITGGIAAMKSPLLARALRRQGADVVAFASQEALRYVTPEVLEWSTLHPVVGRLTAEAEHLSDRAPFHAYLVAPATYNTINKLRCGIADGVITSSLASALGRMEQGKTKILLVPTMHGSLHTSILTESLRTLANLGVRVVPPRPGYGKHNIPGEEELVAEVCRAVSTSPLKGRGVLVTGGPTPVPVDAVRRLTNRFSGELGALVARELFLRGAEVVHVHGQGTFRPPAHVPHRVVATFDEYRRAVLEEVERGELLAGVFSAAVADYRPKEVLEGKTPSGGALSHLELVPQPKVLDEVLERAPDLHIVAFKYQEGVSHEELMEVGRQRLQRFPAVVANRGEETGPQGEQVAYLMRREGEPRRMVGKPDIACALADHLEEVAEPAGGGA